MKPFGIEKQTLLVALVPILVMAVLLESYFVYSRFSDLESALLERSQLLAHQLAASSEYAAFSGNMELLQRNADAALAQQDVNRVVMLDADAKPLIEEAIGGSGQYQTLLAKTNGTPRVYQDDAVLMLYEPIVPTQIKLNDLDSPAVSQPAANKPLGTVILEISKRHLTGKKQEILLFSLVTTLLILMMALMLALRVARRITRPIREMSQAIRNFGQESLDARILPQTGVLELNELATGFNQMAQELQQHQEVLESRIAERTSALAAREHESRTLIENSPDTIARYDRDCRRLYANPAFGALTDGGVAALLGKKPTENPGGSASEIYEAKIKEVFTTGENTHFELTWPSKDGKEVCSHIRLTAEYDLSGAITSVLAIGRDITELNETRAELSRKELAKTRFLAAAGHDLRQPLAAANLFIDTLKLAAPTPKQEEIIQRLDQSMSTFNGLLDALLNVSKLDAGMIKPEYISINVAELFIWLEQNFAPMASEKKLGFKLYFPMREAIVVRSDIGLIKSLLMNLVSNAIKYTPKGAILISVRRRGRDALFQVWDTGMGIPEEYRNRIFDEFYQINNPQRDRTRGLGLGLSIAKRALALLGGEITCHSKVGRGTVFAFRLPLAGMPDQPKQQVVAAAAQEEKLDSSFARGKRFIVVEDDSLVSQAMVNLLEGMGGVVHLFQNAEDALRHANIGHADYFISDYMLGGTINGIQFLNRLRQKLGKPIKAVLMTGDTSTSLYEELADSAWTMLHKPIKLAELFSALKAQES